MSRRVIIGLTGNIATGKSAVMRLAADRGALTIDADKVVHDLLEADAAVRQAVVDAFGSGVQRADGRIDRTALGAIVFQNPAALTRLEGMLHPATRLEIARRVQVAAVDVVMIEAIKLLEGPLAEVCDQVWVTTCPPAVQLERLRVCRGLDEAAALARITAQRPQSEKIDRADVVIDTSGLMQDTQVQFEKAWSGVQSLVSAG
jgi:dephospho-CoA kinase